MMSDSNCLTIGNFSEKWPSLPLAEWEETRSTLHMWVKIVGKIKLALAAHITPVEVEDRTPFEDDTHHAAYDADYVWRFWQALLQANRLLSEFRSWFLGKASPVHLFWGAFDLAVTRFFLWQPLRKKSISIRRKDG